MIWTVNSKADAVVTYKKGDVEVTVDNRGATGTLDKIMEVLMLRTAVKSTD
ncbi:hypothetical protein KAR91_82535 [Candidatus Pacearchaeota archaeon]|nr:hypothetical protein [Candidatus Pacearchaeota archaeon]